MKAVGYALLLVALVVGGTVLCNVISEMAVKQCASQCPTKPEALSTKFSIGPATLRMCNCGEVKK